jgi:hypothetical protein
LHVKLIGVASNKAAIGARVKIVCDGLVQIREVTGGCGYLSQNSLILEFGLAQYAEVDTLWVTWPYRYENGQFHGTRLTHVAADTLLIIQENADPGLTATPPLHELPAYYQVHQNCPNPFNPVTMIRYELPKPSRVSLLIYDLAGRLVRTLRCGLMEDAGYHEVSWNGTDAAGSTVASGTYFYRLIAEDYVETKRMTLIR